VTPRIDRSRPRSSSGSERNGGGSVRLLGPTFAALLGLLSSWAAVAAEPVRETIHLRNGAVLQGEVLNKRPDRVVVDLGFTVISVPMDQVDRIVAADETPSRVESADLYEVAADRQERSVEENVSRCAGAVVQVRTTTGLGSGFLVRPDGYLVTNDHVVAGEHKISVTLFQAGDRELRRRVFENVRIVASDPHSDLALLKIEDPNAGALPTVPLGDADALRPGQTVFSIGSPLGLDRTVSQGIVSLRNRPLEGHLFVQSTVQINPGNSGGPLLNLRGEVVAVNDMKISGVGVEGLSFAVLSSVLVTFLRNRDAFGFDARHPNSGFRYNQPPGPAATTKDGERPR
jgi:serine protease Do